MKKIGICCDHAGFELKEYVRGWLEAKVGNTKTSELTRQTAVTIPILPIHWHWLLKPANAIRELPSVVAVMVSA